MPSNSLQVEPLTPTIGAEVSGVDLTTGLTAGMVADLHGALLKHQVLFFRDQAFDLDSLSAFGRCFGEPHTHPSHPDDPGHPGVMAFHTDAKSKTYGGRKWHSDVTCDVEPPMASILHLHAVPETGGDTLFANMCAAYEALSPTLQEMLGGLTAHHSSEANFLGYYGAKGDDLRDGNYPEAEHPVVRTHPETGQKALFVNEIFTSHIIGLEPELSRQLLDFLYRHLSAPRFQCRFRWCENSVAFWDNRSTQHLALWDYFPETRSGHRFTIRGDKPF